MPVISEHAGQQTISPSLKCPALPPCDPRPSPDQGMWPQWVKVDPQITATPADSPALDAGPKVTTGWGPSPTPSPIPSPPLGQRSTQQSALSTRMSPYHLEVNGTGWTNRVAQKTDWGEFSRWPLFPSIQNPRPSAGTSLQVDLGPAVLL